MLEHTGFPCDISIPSSHYRQQHLHLQTIALVGVATIAVRPHVYLRDPRTEGVAQTKSKKHRAAEHMDAWELFKSTRFNTNSI